MDSAPSQAEEKDFAHRFRDHFETLVPEIQRRWPEVTHQALQATRGSFDDVVQLIASQGDRAVQTVQHQLEDLMHESGEGVRSFADTLEPHGSRHLRTARAARAQHEHEMFMSNEHDHDEMTVST